MKKQNGFISIGVIIITLIVLAIIGGGGYAYIVKHKNSGNIIKNENLITNTITTKKETGSEEKSNSISMQEMPITNIQIQQKQDETADWKTYVNNEYNYSIKYPKDWDIDSKGASTLGLVTLSRWVSNPYDIVNGIPLNYEVITIYIDKGLYSSFEDFFGQMEEQGIFYGVKTKILMNNEAAYKVEVSASSTEYDIILLKASKIFIIGQNHLSDSIFIPILSTLKFLK